MLPVFDARFPKRSLRSYSWMVMVWSMSSSPSSAILRVAVMRGTLRMLAGMNWVRSLMPIHVPE